MFQDWQRAPAPRKGDDALRPSATIIIPLLRQQPEYLDACLASAVAQTLPCQVLVVVSPQTPDTNLEIVRRYCDVANVEQVTPARQGFAAAINTGIEAADTRRISLLLSDDWLDPSAVESCLEADTDIVSASMAIYDATGTERLSFSRPRTRARYEALENHHDRASYVGHFLLFQRDALRSVGGVDETVGNVGPDDFDLIWTLLEHGASVSIVEKEVYGYRDHDGPRLTLRDRDRQISDLQRIFDKHGVFGPERDRLIEHHAKWFGRTLQQVVRA